MNDIDEVTQTARIQKPVIKATVKAVPVIPVTGKPSVVKPTVLRVAKPMLKKPKTDTVKLKVVKEFPPLAASPVIKPVTPVVKVVAPVESNTPTATVKMEKPVVLTKTVKLTSPIKKEGSSPQIESASAVKPKRVAPVVKKSASVKPVSRKPVAPKKKAAEKEEISFDVSDFEDDNVEPSILFMLMNLASAAMFVAGLVITFVK